MRKENLGQSIDFEWRGARWFVLAAFMAAFVPLVVTDFPPVMDYPNHLARVWILGGGAKVFPISEMYVVDWTRASTNVGVDWVAAAISSQTSFAVVDRFLRLAMFLGPAAGASLLGRTIFHRWSLWHAAPLAFVWGTTSIAGFMSYSIGLSAALFAAAAMFNLYNSKSAAFWPLHFIFSAVVLIIHPFGLMFYVALICGIIIGPKIQISMMRPRAKHFVQQLFLAGIIGLVPIVIIFYLSPHAPSTTGGIVFGSLGYHFSPTQVVYNLLSPILDYSFAVDFLFFLPILLLFIFAASTGRLESHQGLALVAGGLAFASLLAPNSIGDASWLDRRLPLMAALSLCAATLPLPETRRSSVTMAVALVVAIIGKVVWIGAVWISRDQDVTDLRQVTALLRSNDAVIVAQKNPKGWDAAPLGRYMVGAPGEPRSVRRHLPSLLVPWKQVFIPTLFSVPGQHAIRVAPQRLGDSVTSSSIPPVSALSEGSPTDHYIERWRCDFDYLLILGVDEGPPADLALPALTQVASQGFVALYRISHPASGEPCGASLPTDLSTQNGPD